MITTCKLYTRNQSYHFVTLSEVLLSEDFKIFPRIYFSKFVICYTEILNKICQQIGYHRCYIFALVKLIVRCGHD